MKRGTLGRVRVIAGDASTVSEVLSEDYTTRLVSDLALDRATPALQAATDATESRDTTHFTVIDPEGNIVTNTYTLSGFFGSQVIARRTGVLLNNHMSAFQSEVSQKHLKPGARYHSTMSPAVVLRPDGSVLCALGTPGAATIPSTLFQVISNLIDFKMSLRDAIEFPRIHAGGGQVDAEPAALVYDVAEQLRAMGHRLNSSLRSQGDVSAIAVEEGTRWRLGWADGRRGGAVKGY
jgi:gamma-glutamyltranspeptidase/glutathione hydrolase